MSEKDPQGEYHDYAAKLDAAKQSVKVDESLQLAAGEIKEVLVELREMEDGKLYKNLANAYMIVAAIVFILHIIFYGYWVGLVGIIVLIVFYFISKVSINIEIKIANSKANHTEESNLLTPTEIARKRMSTEAIIDLKTKRYQILMIMTSVFTPLIFMSLNQLIYGSLTMLNIGIAVVLGSFFWMIYFKKDIDVLSQLKERLSTV